jgi:hypothetical protein
MAERKPDPAVRLPLDRSGEFLRREVVLARGIDPPMPTRTVRSTCGPRRTSSFLVADLDIDPGRPVRCRSNGIRVVEQFGAEDEVSYSVSDMSASCASAATDTGTTIAFAA